MTQPLAQPGEVIDARPLGDALADAKTTTLARAEQIELVRLVMRAGKEIPTHQAPGPIVLHCLEGRIAFTASGREVELGPGQLLYLEAGQPHAVRCLEAASLLLTKWRRQ